MKNSFSRSCLRRAEVFNVCKKLVHACKTLRHCIRTFSTHSSLAQHPTAIQSLLKHASRVSVCICVLSCRLGTRTWCAYFHDQQCSLIRVPLLRLRPESNMSIVILLACLPVLWIGEYTPGRLLGHTRQSSCCWGSIGTDCSGIRQSILTTKQWRICLFSAVCLYLFCPATSPVFANPVRA
jgi:hypothetical protein